MKIASNEQECELTVDLKTQTIRAFDGTEWHFEVDAFRKKCLLEGLDDIGLTLEKVSAIDAFEHKDRAQRPWLYA
jgi:3-isopropylmalate/(R)-2-methylmalate dehydratase small subunit